MTCQLQSLLSVCEKLNWRYARGQNDRESSFCIALCLQLLGFLSSKQAWSRFHCLRKLSTLYSAELCLQLALVERGEMVGAEPSTSGRPFAFPAAEDWSREHLGLLPGLKPATVLLAALSDTHEAFLQHCISKVALLPPYSSSGLAINVGVCKTCMRKVCCCLQIVEIASHPCLGDFQMPL